MAARAGRQVPGLVGVGEQLLAGRQVGRDGPEVERIALPVESDLQLEGAEPGFPGAPDRRHRIGRVDAAGIDRHDGLFGAAQRDPQRHAPTPRRQVPQRDVDARHDLGQRPRLTGLQGEYPAAFGQERERCLWRLERLPQQQRRDDGLHEPRPMLGAAGREVAPHLAPAMGAVAILEAYQHRRTVRHGAERRADRFVDRRAKDEDLQPGDRQLGHGIPARHPAWRASRLTVTPVVMRSAASTRCWT